MTRAKILLSGLLIFLLAAAALAPAASAKKKKVKVPDMPEIPASVLPESLAVPSTADDLVGDWSRPADALEVVAAFLQLTVEQKSSLVTLLQQRHAALAPLIQEINARQQQISQQLNSGAPDPTVIGNLVIEIHQFLQLVQQTQQTFFQAFRNLLNDEQWRRYEIIRLADRLRPFLPAFRTLRLI